VWGWGFWCGNLRERDYLGKPRNRWEDKTKMDLIEVELGGGGAWTGLIWLRTGTGGRLL